MLMSSHPSPLRHLPYSFGQWLIHIDLFGTISEEVKSSKATVKNGTLTFKCVKDVKGVWGKLEVDGKGEYQYSRKKKYFAYLKRTPPLHTNILTTIITRRRGG